MPACPSKIIWQAIILQSQKQSNSQLLESIETQLERRTAALKKLVAERRAANSIRRGRSGCCPTSNLKYCAILIKSSMEALKIFISSVMRRSVEDLTEARQVAFEAIQSLAPIACAWAFEREPASTKRLRDSYIDEVKTCDLLLLHRDNMTVPCSPVPRANRRRVQPLAGAEMRANTKITRDTRSQCLSELQHSPPLRAPTEPQHRRSHLRCASS
jgi:hypothetical protein